MRREHLKDELIVRYLLGDLPDHEEVQVEDRAFADREYMDNVLAVEDDLIDSYLRGSLSATQRAQFEKRFLISSERRQKVEFARALADVSSRKAAPEPSTTFWQSFLALFRNLTPALRFSLAAASLAAMIGAGWLVGHKLTRRQTVEPPPQEEAANRPTPGVERSPEPERAAQPEREAAPAPPTIASLVLLPGVSRSASNRPRLVIPQSSRLARLQVGLDRTDEYKSFRIEIRDSRDKQVWTRDRLHSQQSHAGRVITLLVPASVFRAGQYELSLKGSLEDGKTEDLRYYYFDIQKQ